MAVPYEAGSAEHEAVNGHLPLDAVRSWLVNGVQLVDRRRRHGSHGRARELLVVDRPARSGASERWHTLAAVLRRHAVGGGLSELTQEERHVITLAYMEGRTNREIAAQLGVSVTTARRRLWAALERLDAYFARTGGWLSVLVGAVLIYTATRVTQLGRWVGTAAGSADKAQRLVTTVTAGAVAAAAVGMVSLNSDFQGRATTSPAVAAPLITQTAVGALPSAPHGLPTVTTRSQGAAAGETANSDPDGRSSGGGDHANNGCGGNPTSAPPSVPVGPRANHQTGAPVTHPAAGGCED